MSPYKQLIVNCYTNPAVPPPYSHDYHIVVDEHPSYLTLSFNLRYTEREGLSEEEIFDEGFSPDDDFKWSGKLNRVWKAQLDALIKASRLHQKPAPDHDYTIEIHSITEAGDTRLYVSRKETQGWVYFIQELKQAILESERIESPLTIEYLEIEGASRSKVVLNGSFADRTFTVRVNERPVEQLDWAVLQKTINLIFNETEIDPEQALSQPPAENGYYLLLPGAGWFELESGITARYDNTSVLKDIVETMKSFTGKN